MIKAILFDLDGTLIDTNQLVLHTFKYTLDKILNLQVPDQEIIATFGRPLAEVMEDFDKEKAQLLLTTYRAYNAQIHDDWVTIFPTVKETLIALKQQGFKLAVVTSKKNEIALKGLRLFDLEPYFDVFIGSDDTPLHKPDPDPIFKALEQLDIRPEEAMMVGDSPFDILCGQNAGTQTVGVRYSAHGPEALVPYHPDYLIDEMADLLDILKQ